MNHLSGEILERWFVLKTSGFFDLLKYLGFTLEKSAFQAS